MLMKAPAKDRSEPLSPRLSGAASEQIRLEKSRSVDGIEGSRRPSPCGHSTLFSIALPSHKNLSYLGLVEVAAAAVVQVAEGALPADLLKARAEIVRRIEEGRAAADPAVWGLRDDDGGRGEENGGGARRYHEKKEEEQGREARRLPANHRESEVGANDDELAQLCRAFR